MEANKKKQPKRQSPVKSVKKLGLRMKGVEGERYKIIRRTFHIVGLSASSGGCSTIKNAWEEQRPLLGIRGET